MPNTDPYIIRLRNVRLSFPHLFKPHAMEEGQEPKFSASFLMDCNEHAELIEEIETKVDRIALDFWKKRTSFKTCLRDGNDKPDLDGFGDGIMFITASRRERPAVVDKDPSVPLTAEDGKIYAGCYVNATIRLWVQDNKWGKRVNAELRGVQFHADGNSFGAGPINPEEEFEDESGGSGNAKPKGGKNLFDGI